MSGPASPAEQAQLGGCNFDGGGFVIGGCGPNNSDEIRFDGNYSITLTSPLPVFTDSHTFINNVTPFDVRVDAADISQVFIVRADNIRIHGLRLFGAAGGNSQIYIATPSTNAVIDGNVIGTNKPDGACGLSDNAYGGIYVDTTAALPSPSDRHAWIYGNEIACHRGFPGDGISLYGTTQVVIGADVSGNAGLAEQNYISDNQSGITIRGSSNNISIVNSVIVRNILDNLHIGDNSQQVVAQDSQFLSAGRYGIVIDTGAHDNRIGSPQGGPITRGNWIALNTLDGVIISGTTTSYNVLYGNRIGTDLSGALANRNLRNGVTIADGAHHNDIGNNLSERNLIAGNAQAGATRRHGSSPRWNACCRRGTRC